MDETWVFRVLFTIASNFLAGAIIPLDLFPKWLQEVLAYTPFPYLTYVPAKAYMGENPFSMAQSVATLGLWTVLAIFFANFVWNRGLRRFSGAGM